MKKSIMIVLTLLFVPMLFGATEVILMSAGQEPVVLETGSDRIMPANVFFNKCPSRAEDSLYWCTHNTGNALGTTAGWVEGGMRLTPTELGPYAGWDIVAISIVHHWAGQDITGQVKVFAENTTMAPGALITSEGFASTGGTTHWVRTELSSPVAISGSVDRWVAARVYHPDTTFAYGLSSPATQYFGDWLYMNGIWQSLLDLGLNWNFQIIAYVESSAPDSNVGTNSIDIVSPVPEDSVVSPQATVKNFGNQTSTFDVTCEIEPGGYSSTQNVVDLAAGDSIQVIFTPDFTFATGSYDVTVYTQLGGDTDPSNDTLIVVIDTYDPGVAEDGSLIPTKFGFNASTINTGRTSISLALPAAVHVNLVVYDALGRLRTTIVSDRLSAGTHRFDTQFNLPAGVYFYNLKTDTGEQVMEKFMIVR